MTPRRLAEDEVKERLAALPGWSRKDDAISRSYSCPSYAAACALLVRAAFAAERLDHHPDVLWRYREVTFTLSTHDAGGLSQLDFDLAAALDALF
jgi:4a-hydroxytetrahydrobiopterin dehydratase